LLAAVANRSYCWCDLFQIADWLRLGLHELMAPLAGTSLGVAGLIRTDATSAVTWPNQSLAGDVGLRIVGEMPTRQSR
jgi:hypothetical protein